MSALVPDKILAPLAGRPVFMHSVNAFVAAGIVQRWVVVYRDAAQRAHLARWCGRGAIADWPVLWVRGGRERQDSVAAALAALGRSDRIGQVFIHDCARPLIRPAVLRELDAVVRRDGAACLAHRVVDTIKRLPAGARDARRRRPATLDRARLWATETPQAFSFALIRQAYVAVQRRRHVVTDDAAAIECGTRHPVTFVENPNPNPKLTRPADLAWAEFLLAAERGRP